jgi:hypothetical protein
MIEDTYLHRVLVEKPKGRRLVEKSRCREEESSIDLAAAF